VLEEQLRPDRHHDQPCQQDQQVQGNPWQVGRLDESPAMGAHFGQQHVQEIVGLERRDEQPQEDAALPV
jgi:hypothetical protein